MHLAVLWGTCSNSVSFVCGVNYRETSSEELGGILQRKGEELGRGNRKTPESLKASKPWREFTWPKSYLALIDTTAKSLSALCPSPCSDSSGILSYFNLFIFVCSAVDF